MALAFYVYYRIEPRGADQARAQVEALFERVRQRSGVRGRLLTKRDEPNLWMEVYENVIDAARFEAALQAEAALLGVEALLLPGGTRKVECFRE